MLNYAPIYFANPTLEDIIVQQLRIVMSTNLDWLDYCFHKIERMSDEDGIEWAYSKINDGSDREIKVVPDSKIKSMMFFEVTSSIHNLNVGELSRYNLNIYCWFNKKKTTTVNEDVTQRYVKDVMYLIKRHFRFDETANIEHKRDNVFDFEGLKTKHMKPVMGNYGGFKISCSLYFDDNNCYNINDMSVAIPLADSGTFTNTDLVGGVLTITHKLNSTKIVSITINKANGEVITVMPNTIVSITQITVDLGGIETGTHTWTVTAKPMLS